MGASVLAPPICLKSADFPLFETDDRGAERSLRDVGIPLRHAGRPVPRELGKGGEGHPEVDPALGSVLHKARLWSKINPNPVNDRRRKVLNRMLDDREGHLTTSKDVKLTRCSNDTALRDIQELVERGILVKNQAGGRSTSDRLANPDEIRMPRVSVGNARTG